MGKILFISNCDPFGIGGGSFATHAYVKAFSEALGGESYIFLPEEGCSAIDNTVLSKEYIRIKRRSFFQKVWGMLTGDVQRYTDSAIRIVRKMSGEFTYAVCNGSMSSGVLVDFFHSNNIKVITIHHNYEYEYFKSNPTVSHLKSLFLYHISTLERNAYIKSDYNIFLTNDDKLTFEKCYGISSGINSTLGVFEFKDIPPLPVIDNICKDNRLTFIITGQLFHEQSIDSVSYFLDELYQCLPKDCRVIIAGRNPAAILIEKCKCLPNVTLIPNPENMQDILMQGDVYICPTRLGGGLKLRIMDGLRLGLPVITHNCSARGYDMFFGCDYFKTFSNSMEFSKAVCSIVSLYRHGRINKSIIYEEYIKSFSYNDGLSRIMKLLKL